MYALRCADKYFDAGIFTKATNWEADAKQIALSAPSPLPSVMIAGEFMHNSHCSRITSYHSFISQDFFHFSTFINDGDNLNM